MTAEERDSSGYLLRLDRDVFPQRHLIFVQSVEFTGTIPCLILEKTSVDVASHGSAIFLHSRVDFSSSVWEPH